MRTIGHITSLPSLLGNNYVFFVVLAVLAVVTVVTVVAVVVVGGGGAGRSGVACCCCCWLYINWFALFRFVLFSFALAVKLFRE